MLTDADLYSLEHYARIRPEFRASIIEHKKQRHQALAQLVSIEHRVWLQVADCDPIRPIANEDLERSTPDKTSAVHFMRFELTPAVRASLAADLRVATA